MAASISWVDVASTALGSKKAMFNSNSLQSTKSCNLLPKTLCMTDISVFIAAVSHCCLPAGLMKASSSVMGQCYHPLSSHSVICLAPSPLQEHFPSACKMITGWLLDFPLFFSVYSPFLPSSHLLLFSLSPPLRCSPAHPPWHITLIPSVLPLPFSSSIMLPFFRCSFPP